MSLPELGQAMPRMRVALPVVKVSQYGWNVSKSRFRKKRLLGSGAFGKAFSARLGREKVIAKIVSGVRGVVSPEEAASALHREIVILGKLQKYPFVPRLVEVGPDYFVQEDVGGESMLNLLARKGLEAREILSVVVAAGIMISRIHKEGIAHRDLEPRNILLTPRGTVLIDFGVAVERQESPELFQDGLRTDLLSLLESIVLAASGSDVPEGERILLVSVVEKFRKRALERSVDVSTADGLSRELLFVLANLGARARRGRTIRREKIRVRVV